MENSMSKKDNVLQAVKFALFSASAGVVQVVTFTLLNEFLPDVQASNVVTRWFFESEYGGCYLVALILSVLWNFTINRKFTFKSAANIPIAMLKVFAFYCVFTPLSVTLGELAAQSMTWQFKEYVILALTMATNMITEFLYCRFVVYKNSMNTNELAEKKEKDTADVK